MEYDSSKDSRWLTSDARLAFVGMWVCLQEGELLDFDEDVFALRARIYSRKIAFRFVITKVYF